MYSEVFRRTPDDVRIVSCLPSPSRPINRESPRSMNSTTENINNNNNNNNNNPTRRIRIETMTRFSIGEDDEEEAPFTVKRPRLSDNASQSRALIQEVESDSDSEDEEAEEDDEAVPEMQEQRQQMTSSLPGQEDGVVAANESALPVISSGGLGTRVFFTDPDVLDCPICLDPLTAPVFQCENGHIACSSCCSKVNRKCPSCCMPIGYSRCRAVEKIVESVKVSCKNARYGCRRVSTYSNQTEHEQLCAYAACFCPHPSCPYAGSSKDMYLHFGIQHAASAIRFTYSTTFVVHVELRQKHIFLQEQHESVVFILNHEVNEHFRALSVDCVGSSRLKSCFEYEITARKLGSTLYLKSVPEVYTKWSEHPLRKMYLTLPSDFYNCTMSVHLCIKKAVSPA